MCYDCLGQSIYSFDECEISIYQWELFDFLSRTLLLTQHWRNSNNDHDYCDDGNCNDGNYNENGNSNNSNCNDYGNSDDNKW